MRRYILEKGGGLRDVMAPYDYIYCEPKWCYCCLNSPWHDNEEDKVVTAPAMLQRRTSSVRPCSRGGVHQSGTRGAVFVVSIRDQHLQSGPSAWLADTAVPLSSIMRSMPVEMFPFPVVPVIWNDVAAICTDCVSRTIQNASFSLSSGADDWIFSANSDGSRSSFMARRRRRNVFLIRFYNLCKVTSAVKVDIEAILVIDQTSWNTQNNNEHTHACVHICSLYGGENEM